MLVKWSELKQDVQGHSIMTLCLDTPPSELAEINRKISLGDKFEVTIKPYRHKKTMSQNDAIWGKIGELAQTLYTSNDEVYEEMLRRYAKPLPMRIYRENLPDYQIQYRVVDIVPERERVDGSIFVKCYKGLSQMDSAEAARLLEGILSECKEVGLSGEVEK